MSLFIDALRAEHHIDGFGIGTSTPRLSWSFGGSARAWSQTAYDVSITRGNVLETYTVNSGGNILEPWPSSPLPSRERVKISVRAHGCCAESREMVSTEWASFTVETGLLQRSDWEAQMISGASQPLEHDKKPIRVTKTFHVTSTGACFRLYATAHGIYDVQLNGQRVGDQYLTPGWQSYNHHLNYQIYDIGPHIVSGTNKIVIDVGEGWYAGRLGRPGTRNNFGSRIGVLAQLEADGEILVATDTSWQASASSTTDSTIYDGDIE